MTIKEVEAQSGMTRANIRFYESEGLLSPARSANGYRDYSPEDLEVLKRIRLLRTLHLSLAEIKAVSRGESELSDALVRQLDALEQKRDNLENARSVCRLMQEDGVRYDTLNAQHYLDVLEQPADQRTSPTPVPELAGDVIPKVRAPWRRFWARGLDAYLYSTIVKCVLSLIFHVNLLKTPLSGITGIAIGLVMTTAIEPLLLSRFGTTFGKWVFGFSVTANDGSRLTREDALHRTILMLWKGMAFQIPIWELVRLWNSYVDCNAGETLPWEYDSTLVQKDEKNWRFGLCAGGYAALFVALYLSICAAALPPHHGELTIADFCENYNYVAQYYNPDGCYLLDHNGKWYESFGDGSYIIDLNGTSRPDLQFTTDENGIMTALSWTYESENTSDWPPVYTSEMSYCVLAFSKRGILQDTVKLLGPIQSNPAGSFTIERCGVRAVCEVSYSGYDYVDAFSSPLIPREGEQNEYHFSFSMERT